ncbi:MAG TPA: M20/M25/M40 family metallo-hydrolase, partial [Gemmatimonadales bacterium]
MTEVAGLVQRLVAIPSLSGQEHDAAEFVAHWAGEKRLDVSRRGDNVIVTVRRGRGPRVLLNSHLDTVAPVAGWQSNPHLPELVGEKIVGLGANDAKGCVAAMLCAVAKVAEHKAVKGEV